jgi:putative heme-binding domain-containing protein
MTDAQLVALQRSRSDWHARRARVILHGRSAAGRLAASTHAELRQMFDRETNADWRLRAMWALHVTGGWTADALFELLGDRDEYVRGWAIQLLTEDRTVAPRTLERFGTMARDERSAVVRLYLAAALQRLEPGSRWTIARGLVSHAGDAGDHNLPRMIWLGIEPLAAASPAAALELAGRGGLPLVAQFAARRAIDADAVAPVVAAIAAAPPLQASLLEGMRDGLDGRVDLTAPDSWPATLARLRRSPDRRVVDLAADVAGRFGDTETARRSLETVRNVAAPIEERRRALQLLSSRRRPELVPELTAILERDADPAAIDAIRAVAAFDDEGLGRLLLARFPAMTAAEKSEAMQTFASRGRYGRMLTDALEKKAIARSEVPPYLARQLRRVVGVRFADVWGPVDQVAFEERAFARYRGVLNDKAMAGANPVNGRAVFERTCGACHKMYGEGGALGPDLTGSNRANLDYLLANVINPSADVADAYRMVVVTLRDGRIHTGTVAAETDRQLTLRVVGGDPVVIAKGDIQTREVATTSMMPPGLFDSLDERDVIDLVGFLRTVQPVRR